MQGLMLLVQISALLNIQDLQTRNDIARASDQHELMSRLDDLEDNQNKLLTTLSAYILIFIGDSLPTIWMRRCAAKQFHGNNGLATMPSPKAVTQRTWTSILLEQPSPHIRNEWLSRWVGELDNNIIWCWIWIPDWFRRLVSSCCELAFVEVWHGESGEVFQGIWNKTPIALKVLKANGVAASSSVRLLNVFFRLNFIRFNFAFLTQVIRREVDVRKTNRLRSTEY